MTTLLLRKLTFLSVLLMIGPVLSRAANITLQGTIATDDAVQRFDFTVAAAGAVDIRSYGYAGGTTSTGALVPRGGFDSILTLFSASGVFINENDDGAAAATDPSTGLAADARITANLTAGSYILTLTQYDNFSIGNLAQGFGETGHPNFTADPSFANGGACPGNMFRDISGTDGRCRNGNWAVSFNNVASVTPVAPIPEPSALLFTGIGLGALLLMRGNQRRRAKLLQGFVIAGVAAGSVIAQTPVKNPDFTNVDDILYGNRTLLDTKDLQISFYVDNDAIQLFPITTSNSQQTNATPPPALGSGDSSKVLQTVSAHMFNQTGAVTITPVYNYQHSALLTFCLQNVASVASKSTIWQPRPAGDEPSISVMAAGDFNQDGYDDLVFNDINGVTVILSPNDVNDASRGFKTIGSATLAVLNEMTAGDFDGDGRQEIAGVMNGPNGGLTLVIYTVDPSGAIAQASSIPLTTPGASAGTPIAYTSMARGRFNSTSHDQLAVTFATSSGSPTVEIVDFTSGTLTPVEASSLVPTGVTIPFGYLEMKTGKFALPANPYDQIVWHISSGADNGRFFQIISADPTSLKLTANTGVSYNQFPCAAGIAVGNFDHQQPDPLNSGKNERNPNDQVAFLYCNNQTDGYGHPEFSLNIYSADPTSLALTGPDSISTPLPVQQSGQFVFPKIVSTDLQGRSSLLGEPIKITLDNTKPTIINAVPPMHADYITPVGGSKPVMLNISYIPDGFNSSFSLVQDSKTGASTTGKTSWSAGAQESASASFEIGDVDDGSGIKGGASFKAAQDFTGSTENSNNNYAEAQFDITSTTKKGDIVFYTDSRLNIWLYPVIGQTVCPATLPNCSADQQVPLTIQFSGPDQIETGIASTEDSGSYWYQPPWEFGNVFSYPAATSQLALIYPDLANTQLSNDVSFKTSTSSVKIQATWSSGSEQGSTTATSDNFTFDAKTTFVAASGAKYIGNVTAKASLEVSGSYGFDNLQTNTAQMDASNGIGILSTSIFPDTSNYGYKVSPFILGNSPPTGIGDSKQPPAANIQAVGPLKTAFTADPTDSQLGGSWWSQASAYRAAPDVALNHPNRWVLTEPALASTIPANCGNTGGNASQMDCVDIAPYYGDNGQPLPLWTSNFFSMRGFFITSANHPGDGPQLGFATEGDKLDLAVRVYNYSLLPMSGDTKVHVRFYAMPWDHLGNVPTGASFLIGENVADPIPAFDGTPGAPLNWVLVHAPTPFDTSSYSGKYLAFWVAVWMEDGNGLVKEIQGHGLTSIPGTLTQPSDVPLEMATDTQGNSVSYANNAGFYHYAFPIVPKNPGLGAPLPLPSNPADITLKNVSAAKRSVKLGEYDEITALLRAGFAGPSRLKVYFYDGDPTMGGTLIATETARFEPRSITKVRIAYHPPTDGVHRIYAVINKGKDSQVERHTAAILVGNAMADRNHSDGDEPPNDK